MTRLSVKRIFASLFLFPLAVGCTSQAKFPDFEIVVSPLARPQIGPVAEVSVPDITARIVPERPFSSDTKLRCVLDEEPPIVCPVPWRITGLSATFHSLRVDVIKGGQLLAFATVTVSVEK
jgi:hypothetical protein